MQTSKMKLSAILPTYNRGYILHEAIDSVLTQAYRDVELVIVDDGSTDNTADVVRNFRDDRIHYVRHHRNRGVSAALNTGVKAATGDVVGFLGSDDLWMSDKVQHEVDFLLRHPEADLVFSDIDVIEGVNYIQSTTSLMRAFQKLLKAQPEGHDYIFKGREMYLCLLEEMPIKPTVLVVKRFLFDKVGLFNETWRSGEDWEHLLRLAPLACFGYMNLRLATMRRLPDATHVVHREQDKRSLLELFIREKAKLRTDAEALRAVNRGIAGHCSNLGWHYLHSGRRQMAIGAYCTGFLETAEVGFLLRAASGLLPATLRESLKSIVRG